MTDERANRRLAAILSADVHGYSRLMERDEPDTVARIKDYRALFAELVRQYRGRVVDAPGDNILAEFASVVDAVEGALHIQKALGARNATLPAERRMEFRIGINLGDVIADGEGLYGEGVNIAARLQALAQPGGICLSGAAYEQVEGKLALACDDLGAHEVKNISKPVRVLAVHAAPGGIVGRTRRARARRQWIGAAAATAVLVAAGVWLVSGRPPSRTPIEGPSIAVLPFTDLSPEQDQEYFADGLAEELLNTLSRVPGLRVVARTSSFQFKGVHEDLRIVGQKLNASTILEGSVRKEGARIRVIAQLINAADGFHIWSEDYSYEAKDVFAAQDQIARAVAAALKWTLIGDDVSSHQTTNGSAYTAYLLGHYYSGRRSKDDLQSGVDYLNQAVQLDPGYAAAWVALAVARIRQADWGQLPADEGYRQARAAAERALELNPNLASAQSALGWIRMNHDWNWEGARRSFQRSVELEPGSARVLGNAAALFVVLGQVEEGLSMMRRVVQMDPLNVSAYLSLGTYAYYAGNLEEAAASLDRALELSSEGPLIRLVRGLVHLAAGRPDAALTAIEREPDDGWRLYGLTLAYDALSRHREADAALAELVAGYQADSGYQIAAAYAHRNDADRAFQWLERAYAQRDGGLPLINVDPLMKALRGDPRYRAIVNRIGLAP